MSGAVICPGCGKETDEHLVREVRACLASLRANDPGTLPFEELEGGLRDETIPYVLAGGVIVKAGVQGSPLGNFPVLVFDFASPNVEEPITPIALVLPPERLRDVRVIVGQAIDSALRAARKRA